VAPGWFESLTRTLRGGNAQTEAQKRAKAFREDVREALENSPTRDELQTLLCRPAELGLPEEDVELEIEALQGALDALTLRDAIVQGGGALPVVEHQHKALGEDRCHFVASAFLASEASDRTGRLFLTDRRLLFLATPLLSLSWGSILSIDAEARDLVIASTARGVVYRFRCNSFSDARCAVVIAQALKNGGSPGSSPRDSSATAGDGRSGSR
jgi:hypothetical protein